MAKPVKVKVEKPAISANLPIRINQPVILGLPDGKTAKAHCKRILEVGCANNICYVTIESSNSIYKNIPLNVFISNPIMNGQVLRAGDYVKNGEDSAIRVVEIAEVNGMEIIVKDEEGKLLSGVI